MNTTTADVNLDLATERLDAMRGERVCVSFEDVAHGTVISGYLDWSLHGHVAILRVVSGDGELVASVRIYTSALVNSQREDDGVLLIDGGHIVVREAPEGIPFA